MASSNAYLILSILLALFLLINSRVVHQDNIKEPNTVNEGTKHSGHRLQHVGRLGGPFVAPGSGGGAGVLIGGGGRGPFTGGSWCPAGCSCRCALIGGGRGPFTGGSTCPAGCSCGC